MSNSPTDEVIERAQTSPIGIVLILGITMAAAIAIVVLGTAALDDTQRDTKVGQAEQSLTQFDSRVSQVALGDSGRKTVGLGSGDYEVNPDAGTVTIKHVNATGQNETEVIYEESTMGSVSYKLGDTTIAYQGGGVWREDPGGRARMVSPPEFHYRDATLTFPIIRVNGTSSRQGNTRALVTRKNSVTDVYPNSSRSYDGSSDKFVNPVNNGTVVVEIESQYCEGWRSYFMARTDGNVTACQNDRVEAQIISIGEQGQFDILDGSLEIRGAEVDDSENEEPAFEFNITFTEEGSDQSSGFNNFMWSMHGESIEDSDKQFEVYLRSNGGSCGDDVEMYLYHSNNGSDTYQTWTNTTAFQIECDEDGTQSFTADFLNQENMTYEVADPFTSGQGQSIPEYSDGGRDGSNLDPNPLDNDTERTENVTRHYIDAMGDMDLEFDQRHNAGIGDASQGEIWYPGDGRVVTYLHITENEVEVELTSG